MSCDEILDILLGRSCGGCPDRGVRADDILLGRYVKLASDGGAPAFWPAFAEAFLLLWQDSSTDAIELAAAFASGLEKEARPVADSFGDSFSFLLDDPVLVDSVSLGETRRRVIAGLRLLANLGLGERNWWRRRFWAWIDSARSATGADGRLAWQAVLHASLGLMNSQEEMPNIDAWLEDGRKAKEFPAIELFTLLSRQTEYQQDREHLKDEVVAAFQSLHANCLKNACPQGIEDIRSVIETWLVDRLKLTSVEAQTLLTWREPSRELPQVRLAARKRELAAARA